MVWLLRLHSWSRIEDLHNRSYRELLWEEGFKEKGMKDSPGSDDEKAPGKPPAHGGKADGWELQGGFQGLRVGYS